MLLLPRLLPPFALHPLILLLPLQLCRTIAVAKFALSIFFLLAEIRVFFYLRFVEPVDDGVQALLYMDTFDLIG
jgi:hypothetical protein